jgi:hypothetical protein
MTARNQLTKTEAQRLLDYRGCMLYWRHAGSGQRQDRRAVWHRPNGYHVHLGGRIFMGHYVVWNWHYGPTSHAVRAIDCDFHNLSIENLTDVDFIRTQSVPARTACPCCRQRVNSPTVEVIAVNHGLTPIERAVLESVWSGNGLPVATSKIYDRMYADDPDGGPSPSKMYAAFKVALSRLRAKIQGSGAGIENCGYGQGYRLVLNT